MCPRFLKGNCRFGHKCTSLSTYRGLCYKRSHCTDSQVLSPTSDPANPSRWIVKTRKPRSSSPAPKRPKKVQMFSRAVPAPARSLRRLQSPFARPCHRRWRLLSRSACLLRPCVNPLVPHRAERPARQQQVSVDLPGRSAPVLIALRPCLRLSRFVSPCLPL